MLPINRCFVAISTVPQIAPFFQLLAWEPWEPSDSVSETSPVPAAELRSLVHEKMKRQDEAWRRKLQSLNWTVEDETTLQLLYGKEPLESVSVCFVHTYMVVNDEITDLGASCSMCSS